jgi:hypothetical protein
MRIHPKYLTPAVLAIAASIAAVPASASATHRTSRWISATVAATIGSDLQGGLAARGAFRSPELGNGTIAYHSTVDRARISTPALEVELPGGTLRGSGTGAASPRADGALDIRGTGTFTGGTGRFAHAAGRFVYEGTSAGNSVTLGVTGIAMY